MLCPFFIFGPRKARLFTLVAFSVFQGFNILTANYGFFAYLACYGVLRFIVEAFRGDAVRGIIGGVISTSQLLGILIFVGGTVGVLVTRPRTS